MPGRNLSPTTYRYGFNGKEEVNEINVDDGSYDYGFRFYDSRLGRFLSVDPLFMEFPWNSTYAFAENSPIAFIDLDSLEKFAAVTVGSEVKFRGEKLKKASNSEVEHKNINTAKPVVTQLLPKLKELSASDPSGIDFLAIFFTWSTW